MKIKAILFCLLITFVFSSCLDKVEDYGYYTEITYTGILVDKQTGNPLSDKEVLVGNLHGYEDECYITNQVASTYSDSQGHFSFTIKYSQIDWEHVLIIPETSTHQCVFKGLAGAGQKTYNYGNIYIPRR